MRLAEEHCSRSYFSLFMSMTNHAGDSHMLLHGGTYPNQSKIVWINTYYRCTVVIQDKPKTRFGKGIHGVLAYYIHFGHFEHKKVTDCSFKLTFSLPVKKKKLYKSVISIETQTFHQITPSCKNSTNVYPCFSPLSVSVYFGKNFACTWATESKFIFPHRLNTLWLSF